MVKGQTASSSYKPAKLSNGVKCMVPPFIEAGERIDIDHVHQLATGGADDESNMRPLHPWCHAIKTREDAKVRGKIRRLNGTTKKRAGKPIRSRGFDRSKTRKFNGTVIPRAPRAAQ